MATLLFPFQIKISLSAFEMSVETKYEISVGRCVGGDDETGLE